MFHRLSVHWRPYLFLLTLLVGFGQSANARKYGFLVGVSNYPNLEKKFQLSGPDNDVELMKNVLLQMQVEERDIKLLYSSHTQRPTRENIIEGLRELATKTTANDFVYLFFAGHGSRQPARAGDTEEEDQLDEIFLPEDVGTWSDEIGAVERAITDNEINALITAIRANGTFVWAIFDSCHSGTMLRSVDRIKWRKVDPNALGIPSVAAARAGDRQGNNEKSPSNVASNVSVERSKPGGFVAFYAAQSHELAPELKLPPHGAKPKSHGLFTYQLAHAMMSGAGLSYRQLGQTILQNYVAQGMRATTPLFEGTHLDALMFGRINQGDNNQWPVRKRGGSKPSLFVPAGQLQQIGKGAIFALLAKVSDANDQALGFARADLVEIFGTKLVPIAYNDKPAADIQALPRSTYARMIKPSFQFGLSVAMARLGYAVSDRERRVVRVIEAMAQKQQADKNLNGLRIKWQQPGEPADIHLVFSPAQKSQAATQGCARNHLWFLDRTGALICSGNKANLSFRLQNPSIDFDRNVEKALGEWLNAIGKVRNLEQMVERFKGGRFARKIKIRLWVKPAKGGKEVIVDQASRRPLLAGDRIRLELNNTSGTPVDLTVLFIDSHFGITPIFPIRGGTNRIAAKSQLNSVGGKITSDTLGLEGMVVIVTKALAGTPVADFRSLGQKKLSLTKNVRSMGDAQASLSNPQLSAVEDLFNSAIFGKLAASQSRARKRAMSTRSGSKRKRSSRTPFKHVAIKSLRWMVGN
ncbi:MAG: caspase family protein [bacterium]|nr:caspase family protein [bacterium]